jgi:hypothetical protein
LVAILHADIDDLSEVKAHGPFLGTELVPAAVAEGLVERLELLVGNAQREYLATLEADAYTSMLMGHQ